MADLEEVAALLHVHEKAHAAGHSNIAGAALARLRQINAEHVSFAPAPTEEPTEPSQGFEADPGNDEEETEDNG